MDWLISKLGRMPAVPPVELPLPARAAGPLLRLIEESYVLVFKAGFYQGFSWGFALATAVILGLSLRRREVGR